MDGIEKQEEKAEAFIVVLEGNEGVLEILSSIKSSCCQESLAVVLREFADSIGSG